MTGKDVLLEKKNLLQKAAAMERFEYYPSGKELLTQTEIERNSIQNWTILKKQ